MAPPHTLPATQLHSQAPSPSRLRPQTPRAKRPVLFGSSCQCLQISTHAGFHQHVTDSELTIGLVVLGAVVRQRVSSARRRDRISPETLHRKPLTHIPKPDVRPCCKSSNPKLMHQDTQELNTLKLGAILRPRVLK